MSNEILLPYALTSLDRVKDKLGNDKPGQDLVLKRIINSVTDWIENQCNRRFLRTTYTNELYSIRGERETVLLLKNAPVVTLGNIQYRQGQVGSPTWTNYTVNDFELVGDGSSGMVKFYTFLNQGLVQGVNSVRVASYQAGYLIDFTKMGDVSLHNLPAEISELAEKLVIKWYTRRQTPGKTSETFNASSITWSKELDPEDNETLKAHRRIVMPII
jgi:hypothetical protein